MATDPCSGLEGTPPFCPELEKLRARIRQLEALVYVPGLRECAKCGCQLMTTTVNVPTATFLPDDSPKPCPNGCGPMWPVTERKAGNSVCDRLDRAREEVRAHELVEDEVAELLADIHAFEAKRGLDGCMTVRIKALAGLRHLGRASR